MRLVQYKANLHGVYGHSPLALLAPLLGCQDPLEALEVLVVPRITYNLLTDSC